MYEIFKPDDTYIKYQYLSNKYSNKVLNIDHNMAVITYNLAVSVFNYVLPDSRIDIWQLEQDIYDRFKKNKKYITKFLKHLEISLQLLERYRLVSYNPMNKNHYIL